MLYVSILALLGIAWAGLDGTRGRAYSLVV